MAEWGLSLVGFMQEEEALTYLQKWCIVSDSSPEALVKLWRDARDRLGSCTPGAGAPDIREIPPEFRDYLEGVKANPRYAAGVEGADPSFQLIEIEPLISPQFQITPARSATLCGPLTDGSRLEHLLPICLPHTVDDPPWQMTSRPNGFCIKTHSRSLRWRDHLGIDAAVQRRFAGISYGPSSNLMHVVRFEGRCYLTNGHHRAYGLRKAGATHIPCVYFEATDFSQLGPTRGAVTFERHVLESDNPPTCGHFVHDRAYPLQLRTLTRVISVSWSEYAFLED